MAFIKRTWLARIGTGLNKFLIGTPDGQGKQTLTNSPDSVTQQGDVISADNLNDLEDRIEAGFNEKQDTLTSGTNIKTVDGGSILGAGNIITDSICTIWTNPAPNDALGLTSKFFAVSDLAFKPDFVLILFKNVAGRNASMTELCPIDAEYRNVHEIYDIGTTNLIDSVRSYKAGWVSDEQVLNIEFHEGQKHTSPMGTALYDTDNSVFVPQVVLGLKVRG